MWCVGSLLRNSDSDFNRLIAFPKYPKRASIWEAVDARRGSAKTHMYSVHSFVVPRHSNASTTSQVFSVEDNFRECTDAAFDDAVIVEGPEHLRVSEWQQELLAARFFLGKARFKFAKIYHSLLLFVGLVASYAFHMCSQVRTVMHI